MLRTLDLRAFLPQCIRMPPGQVLPLAGIPHEIAYLYLSDTEELYGVIRIDFTTGQVGWTFIPEENMVKANAKEKGDT